MFEELYRRYPILAPCKESLEQAARLLISALEEHFLTPPSGT